MYTIIPQVNPVVKRNRSNSIKKATIFQIRLLLFRIEQRFLHDPIDGEFCFRDWKNRINVILVLPDHQRIGRVVPELFMVTSAHGESRFNTSCIGRDSRLKCSAILRILSLAAETERHQACTNASCHRYPPRIFNRQWWTPIRKQGGFVLPGCRKVLPPYPIQSSDLFPPGKAF